MIALAAVVGAWLSPLLRAGQMDDSIVAKHLRIRIPVERQWLGRQVIAEMERAWEFVESAAGGKLPNRIVVVVQWQDGVSQIDPERGVVTIGMADRSAASDPRAFLIDTTTRELARMALYAYSDNVVPRDAGFLLDGMSEILAREFSHSVRRLAAAWAVCYYLDRISPLDLRQISGRPEVSAAGRDLRSAAPGITFLTLCSELYGRDKVFKLFEHLGRRNLEESISAAFRVPLSTVESEWLARVRKYEASDVSIGGEEEAPELERVVFTPDPAKPGSNLDVQLFTRDGVQDLSSSGIFFLDETSGRVLQGTQGDDGNRTFTRLRLPLDPEQPAGKHALRIIAVDNGGNVRNWTAYYSVIRLPNFLSRLQIESMSPRARCMGTQR
jgi:hypothetical protein